MEKRHRGGATMPVLYRRDLATDLPLQQRARGALVLLYLRSRKLYVGPKLPVWRFFWRPAFFLSRNRFLPGRLFFLLRTPMLRYYVLLSTYRTRLTIAGYTSFHHHKVKTALDRTLNCPRGEVMRRGGKGSHINSLGFRDYSLK